MIAFMFYLKSNFANIFAEKMPIENCLVSVVGLIGSGIRAWWQVSLGLNKKVNTFSG